MKNEAEECKKLTVEREIFVGTIFRRLNFHRVLYFRRYNHSTKIGTR